MKKIMVLGLGGLILWGCGNANETSTARQATEIQSAHHHDENAKAIELNNGEKWTVNEEMKPFLYKGVELVNTYLQEGHTTYKMLAEQLTDQNNQLVKSCTMTGKSHDELHKWLHPHLELVKELEKQTDVTKANEIVVQLQHSYQEYHQYFN